MWQCPPFQQKTHGTTKWEGCCYEQDYTEEILNGNRVNQNHHLAVMAVHQIRKQFYEIMEVKTI